MDLSEAKEIELTDKPLFDKYFQRFEPEISEFTFTNLFMWRNHYDFLFIEFKNHLLIFSKTYLNKWKNSQSDKKDVIYFLPPVGQDSDKIILNLLKNLDEINIELHRVPESIIKKIKESERLSEFNLEFIEDRDNWDYIYDKQSLISLAGNKYRNKRRLVNKFFSKYDYEFQVITEKLIEKTRELQIEWCDMNECQGHENLMVEQKAIDEIFKHFPKLNINGGILCVEDKCVGYTFGENLNKDTLVIHIEKAHLNYEGSYQAINNLYLKEFGESSKFVNREQDLGISGLRKAKESYKPIHMVKKYIIYQT